MVVVIVEEPSSAKSSGDQGPGGNVWDVNASAPQLQQAVEILRFSATALTEVYFAFSQRRRGLTLCPSVAMRGTLGLKDLCPMIWRGSILAAPVSWTCDGGSHS